MIISFDKPLYAGEPQISAGGKCLQRPDIDKGGDYLQSKLTKHGTTNTNINTSAGIAAILNVLHAGNHHANELLKQLEADAPPLRAQEERERERERTKGRGRQDARKGAGRRETPTSGPTARQGP